MTRTDGQRKGDFFTAMRARYSKCLEPTMSCTATPIRAHSVQNAGAIDLIAKDNHVYRLRPDVKNNQVTCVFDRVGRNEASTFQGMCSHHDTELFKPIDTRPFDEKDGEHLFLLAYRAITKQLHTDLEAGMRAQAMHVKAVTLGEVDPNEYSASAVVPVVHWKKSWDVWRYRYQHYDRDLVKGRFNNILHSITYVEDTPPIVAAASFFPVEEVVGKHSYAGIAVNVMPLSATKTAVVFSYPKDHSGKARRFAAPVMMREDDELKMAVSSLLVGSIENFFIAPSAFEKWSEGKREFIIEQFTRTMHTRDSIEEKSLLNLWEAN